MNRRAPSLKQHATGQWFTKWGGKFHYFGTNRAAARRAFLTDTRRGLPAWTDWRRDRDERVRAALRHSATDLPTVAEQFFRAKDLELQHRAGYYRTHLRIFVSSFGGLNVSQITPQCLQILKEDLLRRDYAHKTVNHHLIAAIRRLNSSLHHKLRRSF